jgi:ketosteroid isomerase-like protein
MRPSGDPLRISAVGSRFVAPPVGFAAFAAVAGLSPSALSSGGVRECSQGPAPASDGKPVHAGEAPGKQGVEMPWFPEFASAAQLARDEVREHGAADPVGEYLAALRAGDVRILEKVWPGDVEIDDPRGGRLRGHRKVRQFISSNVSWLAGHQARAETVAVTRADGRAVVELQTWLRHDGRELAWPVAVVAESPDDRSVIFRTYCSQWPRDERLHVRPPVLEPGQVQPGDVVGRYLAALARGDVDAVTGAFAPDGYFQSPSGRRYARGNGELRSFFERGFGAGGRIELQPCAVTDDGVRCAVEYNCLRWGIHDLPVQAGLGVYERGADGLLAAARAYDDIEAPAF